MQVSPKGACENRKKKKETLLFFFATWSTCTDRRVTRRVAHQNRRRTLTQQNGNLLQFVTKSQNLTVDRRKTKATCWPGMRISNSVCEHTCVEPDKSWICRPLTWCWTLLRGARNQYAVQNWCCWVQNIQKSLCACASAPSEVEANELIGKQPQLFIPPNEAKRKLWSFDTTRGGRE